ncbi:MAG: hypothetical protein M3177_07595 [Pseudomonadota bacterium]|nr:hypothetical protein [Pseudomonadota bacterium]
MFLAGLAAFGLALFACGKLIEEPGGERRVGGQAQAADSRLEWERWQMQAAPDRPGADASDGPANPLSPLANDAQPSVWATRAEWSEEQ